MKRSVESFKTSISLVLIGLTLSQLQLKGNVSRLSRPINTQEFNWMIN